MESNRDRVISIVLNEAEWQAFVSLHPQPVVWLREKIRESIVAVPTSAPPPISRFSAVGGESTTSATTR
jgi:hypothetical protein